jgi:UDP-N-acetylmuramoyl-L-alanyl-D-glutamate--2,6-diaminopimelate ligase
LTDPPGEALLEEDLPRLVVKDLRAQLGAFAAWFYGHPAQQLKLVGVTGTNGKTTVAHLLAAALEPQFGPVALLGTIAARVGGLQIPSQRTTWEAPALQAGFAAMVERGVKACVMEVSSHALDLHRVDGFQFDVAAFTNLSRDHLDYHQTMERYFEAKAELFTPAHARHGIVALADAWALRLARQATIPIQTLSGPGSPAAADVRGQSATNWRFTPGSARISATSFQLEGPGTSLEAIAPLPGPYNLANAALALTAALAVGANGPEAAKALASVNNVPGRMELVPSGPGQPTVVVDYAHAPESVAQALRALRPHTAGQLIAILGAGGDRDHGKRELMGRAAAAEADLVYVTDDNPRSEDPAKIRQAVLKGAGAKGVEVADRGESIARALKNAQETDTVVVLGKGHEATIDYGGVAHSHNDVAVASSVLLNHKQEGAL